MRGICLIARARSVRNWMPFDNKPFDAVLAECFDKAKKLMPFRYAPPELTWYRLENECIDSEEGWRKFHGEYEDSLAALVDLDILSDEFIGQHPWVTSFVLYLCGKGEREPSKWRFVLGEELKRLPQGIAPMVFAPLGLVPVLADENSLTAFLVDALKLLTLSPAAVQQLTASALKIGHQIQILDTRSVYGLLLSGSPLLAGGEGSRRTTRQHVVRMERVLFQEMDQSLERVIASPLEQGLPGQPQFVREGKLSDLIRSSAERGTDLRITSIAYDKDAGTYKLGLGSLGLSP
ncbi:MAG: hypothetical protein HYX92_22730 [Chloroflexi bacterium]|nr:hypothetical protein [Chloroflexota bacterium]